MAPSTWLHTILPCIGRRRNDESRSMSVHSDLYSQKMEPYTPEEPLSPVVEALPPVYEDGIEPVQKRKSKRPSTILIAELSAISPSMPIFSMPLPSPTRAKRSRSEGNNVRKKPAGKPRRSQTIAIGAPTNVRKGDAGDLKLGFAFNTYPSPSRVRPTNLTIDPSDPGVESTRPQTAPLGSDQQRPAEAIFKLQGLPKGNQPWKLAPLAPMPALDFEDRTRDRSGSNPNIKRKPVPIRTRGSSTPASPTRGLFGSVDFDQIGRAVEMPGGLPSPTARTPAELVGCGPRGALSPITVPKTPLAELDASRKQSIVSISSPTYMNRLSDGALDLLNFFPTTPKLSRANSIKSVRSLKSVKAMTRPASTPPLSPTLVRFAETRFSPVETKVIGSPGPELRSPPAVSPRTMVPAPLFSQSPNLPRQPSPVAFADRPLPKIPKTPGTPASPDYYRGRFISMAAGLEITGISDLDMQMERKLSAETVKIFMSMPIQEAMPATTAAA